MLRKIRQLVEKQSIKNKIFLNTFVQPSLFLTYNTLISIPNRLKKETTDYFNEIAMAQAELISKVSYSIVNANLNTLKQYMKLFRSFINEKDIFSSIEAPERFSSVVETAVATIFKREGNDFVRLATSLKTFDGKPASGTYLGDNHPAREKLLKGEAYFGRVIMFNKDYMALYEPLKEKGTVKGALLVAINIAEQLKQLKDFLKSVKVGEKGYVYAVDLIKGEVVVHPEDEGKKINSIRKIRDLSFFDRMLNMKRGTINYKWHDRPSKNNLPKEKVAVFETIKHLNWLVSISYYREDIEKKAKKRAMKLQNSLIFSGLTNILLMFVSTMQTVNQVRKTIKDITEQIRKLREGKIDLSKTIQAKSQDEIGELSYEVNNLLEELKQLQLFREKLKALPSFDKALEFLCEFIKTHFCIENCNLYDFSGQVNQSRHCLKPNSPSDTECPALNMKRILSSKTSPCPLFSDRNLSYICIPLNLNHNKGYIIQLTTGKRLEKYDRIVQYLEEAQPLLQTKLQLEKLREQSLKDELTGLNNRRFLNSTIGFILEQTKRHNKSLGILMCDIDHFKSVNDSYGHKAGDEVLKQIADTIKGVLRKSDLIIRYGGEEFLVLLTDQEKLTTVKVAEKIRKSVESKLFDIGEKGIHITISIGVALYPEHSYNFEEVVKMADSALYKAKQSGRNRVVLYERTASDNYNSVGETKKEKSK